MKIKQQKQIKTFLQEEFGEDKGRALFDRQDKTLIDLIEHIENKTKNQRKTLIQTILPRIALYKSLQEEKLEQQVIHGYMQKYMLDIVAAQKHASTAKMEKVTGFYTIYSHIFLKIMRTTDLWESVQEHDKNSFDATITTCLWHTACVENGCPELCPLFCDVDDVTYGGLKKMGFAEQKPWGMVGIAVIFIFIENSEKDFEGNKHLQSPFFGTYNWFIMKLVEQLTL